MKKPALDGAQVAVVGISCRLPRAPGPEAFWRLLRSGEDAVGETPAERWELSGRDFEEDLRDADRGTRFGAFLEQVDRFEPGFFNISPREAAAMDPQQRLALELGWEALEDAGMAAAAVRGHAAGVFLGAIAGDYAEIAHRGGAAALDRHAVTGLHRSIIANRVSHTLGLTGPSLTVDAAQSASLVAVHLACESLRRGESELALAGGVHLNIDPGKALGAARFGGLSPDGRCFTFDARANGYVRGEGGGIVVLKPLAAARADGDHVYCVLRGSAVNNDGGAAGLTVPSREAQESVIKQAYRRAGLKRSEVQYVELHGSGTAVGDPIEAAALGAVLGSARADRAPLPVGSVKTNIGHLEGAAGIAGLIKTALAIERREIPPSLNFERPNPDIALGELGLRVQDELAAWPREDRPLAAGVSSFGMGGTNCHLVLAEAPTVEDKKRPIKKRNSGNGTGSSSQPLPGQAPFALSAKSPAALRAQAERLVAHLEDNPELDPADVAYSLATTRTAFEHRAVALAGEREELLACLGALVAGGDHPGLARGEAREVRPPVFLFPGQGGQWPGMAADLLDTSPVFAERIEACERALAPHLDWSLREVLLGVEGAPSLERIEIVQPLLFAVMVSLAELWRACGVRPAAVAGHSQGEIAAACVSGGLSLEDAAMLAAVRSRIIAKLAGQGAMVSVGLSAQELAPRIEPWAGRIELAAQNGPGSTVLSAEREALDEFLVQCEQEDVRAREVPATIPSHSSQVEPLRAELLEAIGSISPRSGEIPFHSTVTGGPLDTAELGAEYWYRNLRQPVLFEQVTRGFLAEGHRVMVEVSPHPVFALGVKETIEDALPDRDRATVLGTLRRDEEGPKRFALSLAQAHAAGAELDWGAFFGGSDAKRVALPTYAFQRERLWLDVGTDGPSPLSRPAADPDGSREPDQVDAPSALAEQIAPLSEPEAERQVLAMVRAEIATVLGHGSAAAVEPDKPLKELGFDSLAAVELRDRLQETAGLRLPAAVVFNHPTAARLATFLRRFAAGEEAGGGDLTVGVRAGDEPIAIVGMSCRYPGGAGSPEQLWELVSHERDAIGGFPEDRGWDLGRLFDPDPDHPGTSYAREGGFLHDAGEFDCEFFGIGPREATAMDPQQRLLLEGAWQALEDAGIDPATLRGEPAGVFAGTSSSDYTAGLRAPEEELEGYRLTGSAASVASGRIAYSLGLEGPAMTIDTACSSSLVALHLAAQALRAGECSLALAGGATVLGSPGIFTEFSRQRGLAPDGRCKPFAEAADGTSWAEGVGVVALERLSDAQAHGHPILAVIKGSAVNQDGASNGLTAPNGPSQERVIRQALANARLEPRDVDAVEAHGTGTTLGDPIEAGALLATYGQDRETPLRLGSIKSNIGHAQAAAGVAGVIKTVMAMREGVLPKTLHLDAPSSKVDWESGEVELLAEQAEWKADGRPRRAAVSSFGISGTNAHLILEEAPVPSVADGEQGEQAPGASSEEAPLAGPISFALSAKSPEALRDQARALGAHLAADPELRPTDVAYSLSATRSAFEHRAVVLGADREELLGALGALGRGEQVPGLARGSARAEAPPVFLFPGQGAQHARMAVGLLDSSPVFARRIEDCERALSAHVEWSLVDVLREEEGRWLDRLDVVQPALFAVMVSLAELWRRLGAEPAAVAGHSQGEIAAACVAGGLSLDDAALIVSRRAQAMAKIAGRGAMLSLSLPLDRLPFYLEPLGDRVSLAAINGPASLALSGQAEALSKLRGACEEDGVRCREIAVDYAAHSVQIEALEEQLLEAFAPISPRSGRIPFYSTVSGEPIDTKTMDAGYWYRNLRQTVLLEPVLRSLLEQGQLTFVEISPHPVLSFGVEETIEDALPDPGQATVLGSLRRGEDGAGRFALSFAEAWVAGAVDDREALFEGTGARRVKLPTYPFQRKRYWLDSSPGEGDPASIGQAPAEHPLLGAVVEDPRGEGLLLTGRLSLTTHPWLKDHAVAGTVLLPGTAFVEMALRAGRGVGCDLLEELALQAPMLLPEQGARQVQVSVGGENEDGRREVAFYSRAEAGHDEDAEEWTCHGTGLLSAQDSAEPAPVGAWPPEGSRQLDPELIYEQLAERDFDYGPAFQGMRAVWQRGDEAFAEVSLGEEEAADARRFGIHPALLDAALHIGLHLLGAEGSGAEGGPVLPFAWHDIRIASGGASSLRVRGVLDGDRLAFTATDDSGVPVVSVGSLVTRRVEPDQLRAAARRQRSLYRLEWREVRPGPGDGSMPPSVAILGEAGIAGLEAEPHPDLGALVMAMADSGDVPGMVLADLRADAVGEAGLPESAHSCAQRILELLQVWIEVGQLVDTRLVFLTSGAVAVEEAEAPNLTVAPVLGLLRSANSERPDRFASIDTDGDSHGSALLAALASDEPQLALRQGRLLAPRLTQAAAVEEAAVARPIDPDRTVLITGGTSGIGALVARHLASAHGARRLLLVSRSGRDADGAEVLAAELAELGAEVTIASCDVADREQLGALIDSIPADRPLGAVVHSAGILDDGVLESIDRERLERTMRPKVDAAWNLHELTKDLDLSQFLVFSSTAGLLGGAAQTNYAAANAFLDALAAYRHARGLPATALAWGLWGQHSNAWGIDDASVEQRVEQVRGRLGFAAMPPVQGLELFDAARASGESLLAPVVFDPAALRAQAKEGTLPALLRELVRLPVRRRREGGSLAERLAALSESERRGFVLDLVRGHAAAVLGHGFAQQVDPDRAFKEMGFDSLGAVELRNRLAVAAGLRLAPTVVFDHPTVSALADFLLAQAVPSGGIQSPERRAPVVRGAAADEPIAIVGMSCRYPGGVASPRGLWRLLEQGGDAISRFPEDRGWDLARLYDPDPDRPASCYAREGGFVDDFPDFDSDFFGISPREALGADPQQRLLLEAAWEALEDAGIDPATLRGEPAGVFAGVMYQDYGSVTQGFAPGMSASIVTGRVAYTLGLEGPTMTVDTACSSSLVAIHLASQSLRGGECDLALAGGVTVFSTPGMLIYFSGQRALAPDGRCKPFAEGADGTALSEGVGVLALERLSDAQANGHPVLAVIKGSAVNQDGASNGLTAPNGPSQERVIRQALANARLTPQDVDAVEAHGTGTTLGDPIEAGALLATYGQDREAPLRLGSIKSNIGHTQAAAGVAGVIKTVMAMREGVLPKTLHLDAPSSKVDWESGEVELLSEPVPWEPNGHPRRAGVSSFGASGTNAHLILEEAPEPAGGMGLAADPGPGASAKTGQPFHSPTPLALSAKSPEALAAQAERLATHLKDNPDLDPKDVAYSLTTTRSAFEHRAVALGTNREELLAALGAIERSEPGAITARAPSTTKLAYLLTGQGSQRVGMGKELYESHPTYRDSFDQICALFDEELDQPLKEIVFGNHPKAKELLEHTSYAQPALFALEVSLHRLLQSWGMKPSLLAGHSIGEIAAAHISGVLSIDDATKLVAARGKLMGELPEGGAMAAIQATEQELSEAIAGKEQELSIAAINGPDSVVLSGAQEAVEQIVSDFSAKDRKTKRLAVSHAFHSPLMEPMLEPFEKLAATLTYNDPKIPIVSNVSGELLSKEQATDPAYWVSQVRSAVRFADAVATLKAKGTTAYLEIGPDAVLAAMAAGVLQAEDPESPTPIPTLREGRGEVESLAQAIAWAHAQGAKLDWEAYFEGTGAKAVKLPTYAFQRKRYWLDPSMGGMEGLGAIGQAGAEHPLLGAVIEDPQGEGVVLTGRLSLQSHPWLEDHAVAGTVLLPGTAFVELALRAGEEVGCELLEELTLEAPLILSGSAAAQIQVVVGGPDGRGSREISIHARSEAGGADHEAAQWTRHAQGVLSVEAAEPPEPLDDWPPEGAEPLEVDYLYDRLAEAGFDYGPAFQGVGAAWKEGEAIYAEVALDEEQAQEAGLFGLHPALTDAALHALFLSAPNGGTSGGLRLPFSWSGVALHRGGATELRVRMAPVGASGDDEGASLVLADPSGSVVAEIGSLKTRPVSLEQLRGGGRSPEGLMSVEWRPPRGAASPDPSDLPSLAILGEDDPGVPGAKLHESLEALLASIESAPASAPEVLLASFPVGEGTGNLAEAARQATAVALELAQAFLDVAELAGTRLAILTSGAIAVSAGECPDIATAPVWGLLRSAQSEHPDRFCLIDSDGTDASLSAVPAALALEGEPQLVLREGAVLVPRLGPVEDDGGATPPLDPARTALITGATGALGGLAAKHLVRAHGVRRLLLVSKSGPRAPAAAELCAELRGLGAEVEIAACDVSDRGQLEALLASIPAEHRLGAVIHAAGAIDDATIDSLDRERLAPVFAPKADAAWHLHELTAGMDLAAFVTFSSAAGTLGTLGQGNYAAANVFLDALAEKRRAEGRPAASIAWGYWQQESAMTARLAQADLVRMRRSGIGALSDDRGLALFDQALARRGTAIAIALNRAGLREQAAAGVLPALLSGLVAVPKRRSAASGSLAAKLAGLPEAERSVHVLELVRSEVAAVLGHGSAGDIDPARAFKEMGFDSLAAVELRNRLGNASGLRLAATTVFDYPSPQALADHLLAEAGATGPARRVAARAQASDEPIAILGMSCRYPGGASSPERLWELVAEGRDAITGFPEDRGWDLERLYSPDPETPNTSYAREGGFLADAADFDPGFFEISPSEALATDPQQRLLLEVAWEALEDARIDPASLRGTQTGVFAGVMYQDYGSAQHGAPPGMSGSIVSGRVAYALGLEGPTMSIDTACSSSLVAMHLAAQALRAGECALALVGGVTVLATPGSFTEISRNRGLAPDGRCKSFAEAADGAGFSEGVGVLALQRLSDARRSGHPILATIRGSAVNQDGASNGLTAPNGPSQERVIRQALANARLEPKDVDAVEAHGTGTTLGDPIEAGALLATYGQDRETPLRLGSIKSNIGHTQAAAGVAGVIKTVMAMREGVLPKTLHLDAPSSKVDWESGEVELLSEPVEWKPNGHPRRAGVSSFGVSGTNAHLILEEAPEPAGGMGLAADPGSDVSSKTEQPLPGSLPLVLSAKTEPALAAQAKRLGAHLRDNPELDPANVAYSLATTRSAFEHRAVAVGADREELLGLLDALGEGSEAAGLLRGMARAEQAPVFLFGGQGAQHRQMAVELLDACPVFARQIEECEEAFSPYGDWSLSEVLRDEEGEWLGRAEVIQPALFAVSVSLAELWRSCGVRPAAVVGHSQGEVAAAYVAGGLSLGDAARIVALRSQILVKPLGPGTMVSTDLSAERLASLAERWDGWLEVAAENGPNARTLAIEYERLEEFAALCEQDGTRVRKIPTATMASHSSHVEPLREELLEAFAPVSPRSGEVPFHSPIAGGPLDTAELGPEYWYRNVRQTVRFEHAIRGLLGAGHRVFVEVSPHPVFSVPVRETIEDALPDPEQAAVLGTLHRKERGPERFARSLAAACAGGVKPDWDAFFAGSGAKPVKLPTYAFQRQRYWLDSTQGGAGDLAAAGQANAAHPLLGAVIEDPKSDGIVLTGRLSLLTHPWLRDHALDGTAILPGTAFVELALRAGEEAGCDLLEELTLQAPLILPEDAAVRVQVSLGGPDEQGDREIEIHSRPDAGSGEEGEAQWILHAQGVLSVDAPAGEPLASWPPEGAEPLEVDYLYDRLAEAGCGYGPAFQGVQAAWQRGEEIYAEVCLAEEQAPEAQRFGLHPALLDSAVHVSLDRALGEAASAKPLLPFAWREVSIASVGAAALRVRVRRDGETFALDAFDESGAAIASIGSVLAREVDPSLLQGAERGRMLHRLSWQAPAPRQSANGSGSPSLAILGETKVPGAESHRGLEELREAAGGDAGAGAPEVLLVCTKPGGQELPAGARKATWASLELLQRWLADEPFPDTRLAILTEGAVAVGAGEVPDLETAPVWGLLRSAQAEHPGRFCLIDTDGTEASLAAVPAALALDDEPQLAVRGGEVLVPRLDPVDMGVGEPARPLDPEQTVLITGATGSLGSLLARHLVEKHGARRLLLTSRSGPGAAGAAELRAALEELGAKVEIAACDVSERAQLEALLATIPAEHPLGAVVHSAVVLDDGLLESLDRESLERVMRPKADAAWHLHELTAEMDLSAFVMFSSAAGAMGSPGQGNYAAANVFLDALAAVRRAEGRPAVSIAWGLWERLGAPSSRLDQADVTRVRRSGFAAISDEQGLALFDQVLGGADALSVAVALDRAGLRAQASSGRLSPLLRGLVSVPKRRSTGAASLAAKLAGLSEADREARLLELVRTEVAAVLGHGSAEDIDPERAFKEMGFDSLAAVELRNRLAAATGLRLEPTVVFDHPAATAMVAYLMGRFVPGAAAGAELESQEGEIREALASIPLSRLRKTGLLDSLLRLAGEDGEGEPDAVGESDAIDSMDVEELIQESVGGPEGDGAGQLEERVG